MLFEKERSGRRGRAGFEIMGSVLHKSGSFYVQIDVKNTSNFIHEIIDISVGKNYAGFELAKNQTSIFRGRCIQKNEICMLELMLIQDEKLSVTSQLSGLNLDFSLETNLDSYDFKVPYPLSILLQEVQNPIEDFQIETQISDSNIIPENQMFESYEENLGVFGKMFENNRIYKSRNGGFYFAKSDEGLISVFKIEKKTDSDIEISIFSLNKNYSELMKQQL